MATVEQYAIDSWYFDSRDPDTKLYDTYYSLKGLSWHTVQTSQGYSTELGAAQEAAFVIGLPSALKKEIPYSSLKLAIYVTSDVGDRGIGCSLNKDYFGAASANLYGSILPASIALNSYNNIPLGIYNTSNPEAVLRSLFNASSEIMVYPRYQPGEGDRVNIRSLTTTASTGKPKLVYTANDIVPVISNLAPQSGNIASAVAKVFTYSFALPSVAGYVHTMPVFSSATMEWKVSGSSTVNTITSSTNGQFTVPANTFTEGTTIQWRMRAKTDDGVYSAWSSWYTLTVNKLVSNIAPTSGNISAVIANNFTYTFETSSVFSAGYMEWKLSGSSTVYARTSTTNGVFAIPAGTFPEDSTIQWRMRTKTTANIYSAWSSWYTLEVNPMVTNIVPKSGSIIASVASEFKFTFDQASGFSSAEMQWRLDDDIIINTRTTTTNGKFAILANVFSENTTIQWRMRAKTTTNVWSAWSDWYTITVNPMVTGISPQSGNIIASETNNFTFGFGLATATAEVQAKPVFGEATMEWKLSSGGTVYTRVTTTNGKFAIPANTFTDQTTIMWRMKAKTSTDAYGAWSAWYTIGVGDLALTATAISPVGQFIDSTKSVVFSWGYSSGIGRPQAGFEAQISYDSGGGYVALFSGTGAARSYTLPAGTLSAGGFKWKIRVKNDLNAWSPYSAELSNRVVAAPSTPIVAAADGSTSRPNLVWQTDTQLAYQIKILDESDAVVYESGTVNSKERRHTVKDYLADGTYMVMVMAQNEYMKWSAWGIGIVTIDTAASKPTAPELAADSFENYVQLRFYGVDETIETLIVYRDGKPIAQIAPSNSMWEDYTCDGGAHAYFVRVTKANLYADTVEVIGQAVIKGRLLAAVGDTSNTINLKYRRGERPSQAYSYASGAVMSKFEGRSRPCGDRPDAADFSLSFDASVLDTETVFALIALADRCETVIYRDGSGVKMFAQLDVIKPTIMKRFSDIQISMTQVDYSEVITIA